jgi:hypothetical protein
MPNDNTTNILDAVSEVLETTRREYEAEIATLRADLESMQSELKAALTIVKAVEPTQNQYELEIANLRSNLASTNEELKKAVEAIQAIEPVRHGKDGENGCAGAKGEDGKDRFVISAMPVQSGQIVDKNTVVSHRGGLFTSDRKANGTPSEDPSAYTCLVNGISDTTFTKLDDRLYELSIEHSDGLIVKSELKLEYPLFVGTFSKDANYEKNDIIIKDRKTLINRGGGNDDWKMFVFAEKGDKGDAGKDAKDYIDALAEAHLENLK